MLSVFEDLWHLDFSHLLEKGGLASHWNMIKKLATSFILMILQLQSLLQKWEKMLFGGRISAGDENTDKLIGMERRQIITYMSETVKEFKNI